MMIKTCFLFLFILYFTAAMYIKNNEIFDLQETTSTAFQKEAEPWVLMNLKNDNVKTSVCSGTYLVAGYGVLKPTSTMQRSYIISQTHKSVFITFDAYMMGKWAPTDKITIKIKGGNTEFASRSLVTIPSSNPYITFSLGGNCITSNSASMYSPQSAYISSPHTGSDLTLLFQFSTPAYTGTFGIRNVRIMISNTDTSGTQCISVLDMTNGCGCAPGKYLYGYYSCYACDPSCATCASSTTCYSCASNYYYTGTACVKCATGCATCSGGATINCLTCQLSSSFLFPDGSCRASCPTSYKQVTAANGVKRCNFPCDPISNYYFPDGSCQATCDTPFKPRTPDVNGVKFCDSPCPGTTDFYYPRDNTCKTTCSSPLISSTKNGVKFCNYPCETIGDFYYTTDNVCRPTCGLPLKPAIMSGVSVCTSPCTVTTNFYYPRDDDCKTTCSSPLISTTESGVKICNYPCATIGDYYYISDSICRSNCDSPFTKGVTNTVSVCKSPCDTTPGKFYYPRDNNCKAACDSPLTSTPQNGVKFCNYPCPIIGDYYYNSDNICRPTCDLPFKTATSNGVSACNPPCNTDQFYFPDDKCRSACDSPFKSADKNGANFCNYPCDTPGDYFMDGNCQPTCDSPFIPFTDSTGANFCNHPCNSADFYYTRDGTCRENCNPPFTSSTDANGGKLCEYPCGENEFRNPDGSCSAGQCPNNFEVKNYLDSPEFQYCDCVSPNTLSGDKKSCNEPFIPPVNPPVDPPVDPSTDPEPEPEVETHDEMEKKIENIGSIGNTTGVISSVGLAVAAIAIPGDPGGVSTGALTKIIQYSKFLNISYPDKLMMMFKAYNPASGIVSFVPKMTDEQKSKFRYEPLPYNFVAYGVHSCFIVNFWNFMIFLLVLFGVCAGCLVIEKLSKEAGVWARKVRAILQNFWIVQLYNSSGDIMLFSIIQFKDNTWNSSEDTLSFLMAILFMLILIIVFIFHLRTSMEYQKIKKKSCEVKKFEKTYECQQIFYGSFTDLTMNHQLFLFYFALRIMFHNLIIATLVEFPIVQTTLMISLSLLLILYIFTKSPFKSKIDLAQNLTYELIVLTVNIALLIFASLDGENKGNTSTRNNLAELIIVSSVMFSFLSLFFIALKVIIVGIQFYKEYKQKKKANTSKGSVIKERTDTENNLNQSHQGLHIKQPRELNNLKTSNTIESNSNIMEISNLENENKSMRIKNQINKRKNTQLSSENPLDLSTSLYPLNNNNNSSALHYQNSNHYFDRTLDFTVQNNESLMEREKSQINLVQQDQISPPLFEEISITPEENILIGNRSGFNGRKRRMLNNRPEILRDEGQEEIKVHPNNDETLIEENIMTKNKRRLNGPKRRMLNDRIVDTLEMPREDGLEEISIRPNNDETLVEENIIPGNKRGFKGIKRRMLNNRNLENNDS